MLEDTRQTSLCKPVSKTILLGCENGSFPSLFDCHLAISQSSTACYTSFKRGDSGLPADVKIRTIFQLIGIVWSYFLRISRYQCIYICICIQIRIQIVSKYLVSFPSLMQNDMVSMSKMPLWRVAKTLGPWPCIPKTLRSLVHDYNLNLIMP